MKGFGECFAGFRESGMAVPVQQEGIEDDLRPRLGDLPWKLGAAGGVYFEGDLTSRVDEAYEAAYDTGGFGDPIRTQRFALMATGYVQISDYFAVEGGYIQKLFGA